MKPVRPVSRKVILAISLLTTSMSFAQGLTPATAASSSVGLTPAEAATPVVPSKKVINETELDLNVKRAAEIYVRDIIETIGLAYQVRFNLYKGLQEGKLVLGDYDLVSNVKQSSYYSAAYSTGTDEGQTQGAQAGLNSAQSVAHSQAIADINAAVDLAIDSAKPIEFKMNIRDEKYSGAQPQLSAPQNVESRIVSNRSSTQAKIRQMLTSQFPSELMNSIFDIQNLYRQNDVTIPQAFRGDMAFENWNRNTLSSANSSEVRAFYRSIGDTNVYENAPVNQSKFRSQFVFLVSKGLEQMWPDKVQTLNLGARELGKDIYINEAKEFAKKLGQYDGYNSTYTEASRTSFHAALLKGDLYKSSFSRIKNQVENSFYLTQERVSIVSEENLSELTLGDTFDVYLQSIANRGMKEGQVDIKIISKDVVLSMGETGHLKIAGLTRVANNLRYQRIGWISDVTAPDQNVTVTAQVGDKTFSNTFKMSFEAMIKRMANPRNEATTQILAGKMRDYMKAQYNGLSGFGDQYKKRREDMLLVRMFNAFNKMNETEKAELRKIGQYVRDAFGGAPSKFLNPIRNDWDETQKMMSEMALPGTTPKEVNATVNNQKNDSFSNN